MGGVPGRSKGCLTCKKRRVKCDEAKPVCERCTNAYMICEGYVKPIIFVQQIGQFKLESNDTPSTVASRKKSTSSASSRSSKAKRTTPVEPTLSILGESHDALSQFLSLSGFRTGICITYTTSQLFPGNGQHPKANPESWILAAIEKDKTSVVYHATCCLSVAFFARVHRLDSTVITDSATYYGTALRSLNANLASPDSSQSPSNIVASLLMGIYEMSILSDGRGWIQHAGGVGRLIESRGITSHSNGPARLYLQMCRIPIISQALACRKRCFLERDDWRSVTSTNAPVSNKTLLHLVDIYAAIPGLCEDSDRLYCHHMSTASDAMIVEAEIAVLQIQLISTLSSLFIWRFAWERSHPGAVTEVPISTDTSSTKTSTSGEPLYQTRYTYNKFHTAREPILYNTILLLLLDLCKIWSLHSAPALALAPNPQNPQSQSIISPLAPATNPLTLPHPSLTASTAASEIIRSLEYQLQPPYTSAGAMLSLLPIRICIKLMPTETAAQEQEKMWLEATMRRIGREYGFRFGERLVEGKDLVEDLKG